MIFTKTHALDCVYATELAAIAAAQWRGLGDEKAADQAAVTAMRHALNGSDMEGRVVIGEGERDEAPMLYIGEEVGSRSGPQIDIALDPLEGTTLCAKFSPNSLSVMAFSSRGGLLHAPDCYMDKIAIGPGYPPGTVDLDLPLKENMARLAKAKGVLTHALTVCILERPRHAALIADARSMGAHVYLIPDGDVAGVIHTASPTSCIDLYIGTGGAPEGVLAAAALKCIGGDMQGRLVLKKPEEIERARTMGISDPNKKFTLEEMVLGEVLFSATGVTDGSLVRGVSRSQTHVITQSLLLCSRTRSSRRIETTHPHDDLPSFIQG